METPITVDKFTKGDSDTRSQSQNEEGPSIPSRDFRKDLGTTFLIEATAKVW